MAEVLVITCPGGKQCSHLLPLLTKSGQYRLRLAAHSPASKQCLEISYPEAEVVVTDLSSLQACQALLEGATSVYHVGPSFHSREQEMGFNMIDAAVAESQKPGSTFKHFVFSSVLCTQHRNLMQHDLKARIEERLFLSPLNFTILQPTNFMDAYPVAHLAQAESPSIHKLWTPDIPNSVIALRDLAEAAKIVLQGREKHYFAQYPLASTLPISDAEIIKVIGKAIGKEIRVETPAFETGVDNVIKYLFGGKADAVYSGAHVDRDMQRLAADGDLRPDITRDEAERLILFYNRRGLKANPGVLKWLLGREPTTVEQWVKMQLSL